MRVIKATFAGMAVGVVYGALIGGVTGSLSGLGFRLVLPGALLAALFIGVAAFGASVGEPN